MRIFLCVLSLFVMLSCHQKDNSEFAASTINADESTAMVVSQNAPPKPVPERKLIRNGSMSFEVKDVLATRQEIVGITNELNGYITSEKQIGDPGNNLRLEQVVRIPGNSLDVFIARIDTLASRIEVREFTSKDVTEEFIDLESRLRAKKDVEARYREIVKQAKNVEEVLNVENELGNVRSEIEQMEGRLKYLANQTTFSTVALNYHEPHMEKVVPGIGSKFAGSFVDGWNGFMVFLVAITKTWPFLMIIAGIAWLVVRRKRSERIQEIQSQ